MSEDRICATDRRIQYLFKELIFEPCKTRRN